MTILLTNDDGISAPGLWVLAKALKGVGRVLVVAPDREQSAIGTAVTLHAPLHVKGVKPEVEGVEAYSVEGTPADCVIVGLGMPAGDSIELVVSGINQGANLGDDVLISGTVSGALQGYLHDRDSLAISADGVADHVLQTAARLAALLAKWSGTSRLGGKIFLNVNIPDLPLASLAGIEITNLATGTHVNGARGGAGGEYWLERQRREFVPGDHTDLDALHRGAISITPLHSSWLNRPAPAVPPQLGEELLRRLKG